VIAEDAAVANRYRRSPFLLLHWEGQDAVLLNADTLRRFRVDVMTVRLLAALDQWACVEDLAAGGMIVSAKELSMLADMGVIEVEPSPGHQTATGGPSYWSVFDLAVHRQSNVGGYREAQVRARGTAPPPTFKPCPPGAAIVLPPPGELRGAVEDVLERRRSVRAYAERPMSMQEMSGLLYHSARIRGVVRDERLGELAFHPYAAGGGRGELELYVVANDVDGLARGAHYYDARRHQLVQVAPCDDYQGRLNLRVHDATAGMLSRDPPAVVVITAVFARMMWKYKGIALATIYKNAGCLIQTLYLVSTALGLAPCGMGGGEEAATARWLGLDPLVESQVGCFLVGPSTSPA